MLIEELVVVSFVLFLPVSQGVLYQVNKTRTPCFSDEVAFICTNKDGPIVQWTITTINGLPKSIIFHSVFEMVGLVRTIEIDSTPARAELISGNSSFYITSLHVVAKLSSTILCNAEKILYTFDNSSPMQLFLQPNSRNNYTSSFIITWEPYISHSDYNITVSSHPTILYEELTIMNKSLTISLINDLLYNFTISFSDCSEQSTSTFTLGCPLVIPSGYSVHQFKGNTSGNWSAQVWSAQVNCSEDDTMYINCMDGKWESSNKTICENRTYSTEDSSTSGNDTSKGVSGSLILASIFGSVGIVGLTALITVVIIIMKKFSLSRNCNNKSLVNDLHATIQTKEQEPMYQQLSNRHFGNLKKDYPADIETHQAEYSTIHQKYSSSQYSTLSIKPRVQAGQTKELYIYDSVEARPPIPNTKDEVSFHDDGTVKYKREEMKYTYIESSDICGNQFKPNLNDALVDYTNICSDEHPEDKNLNLDSLLIQLRSISENFRLFGSVAGISPDKLNRIVSCCATSYDGLLEVCDLWLKKCQNEKSPPTWHAVAEILSLIGHYKLADDILQVYATGQLPIQVDMISIKPTGKLKEFSPSPPPIPPQDENILNCSDITPPSIVDSEILEQDIIIKQPNSRKLRDSLSDGDEISVTSIGKLQPCLEKENLDIPQLPIKKSHLSQ